MVNVPFLHDIRVFDGDGRHVVGHVVAVEAGGMQILADQAFDRESEHMLMMDDLGSFEPGKKLLFSAMCDLCDPDEEVLDLYHVHLCFTQLSPGAEELTHLLM